MRLYHRIVSPKDADRMANSEDTDQTAPPWVYTVCPDLSVRKRRIITVALVLSISFNNQTLYSLDMQWLNLTIRYKTIENHHYDFKSPPDTQKRQKSKMSYLKRFTGYKK